MTEATVSNLSIRLRDPARDVGSLFERWGLATGGSWVAGEERRAPNGRLLGGIRKDSYAYSRLKLDEPGLGDALNRALDRLKPFAEELIQFVEEGGRAELYVSMDCVGNAGTGLDWQVLRRLAD